MLKRKTLVLFFITSIYSFSSFILSADFPVSPKYINEICPFFSLSHHNLSVSSHYLLPELCSSLSCFPCFHSYSQLTQSISQSILCLVVLLFLSILLSGSFIYCLLPGLLFFYLPLICSFSLYFRSWQVKVKSCSSDIFHHPI